LLLQTVLSRLSLMTNPAMNQVYDGATVPRGASVAYATTTPTEHFPFNQLSQQSETLSRLLSLGQSIIPCNGKTSFVAG
ncbi:hypothetical protein ACXMRN_001148, partial [Yersinia enterocolitica]